MNVHEALPKQSLFTFAGACYHPTVPHGRINKMLAIETAAMRDAQTEGSSSD